MKKTLVFALALMLVLAFATSAMALQYSTVEDDVYIFDATPKVFGYGTVSEPTVYNAAYEYPNGIYLPNAQTPADYRIHTSYAKNTDACASCHSTHTAVGNNLLQWYSTYETCMACHDGTVSTTYDVATGNIGATGSAAMGGAFGIGGDLYVSNHNVVNSSIQISAAPGGSLVGDGASWNIAFGCESCHTPHGNGGNARILHPNPNNVAVAAKKPSYTVNVNGYVYDGANQVLILKGYPYTIEIKDGSTVVTAAYIDNTEGVSKVVYAEVDASYTVVGTPALRVEMYIQNYLEADESVQHLSGMNAFCGACHTDYNTEGLGHTSDKDTGTYSQAHRHQVGTAPKYNTASNLALAGMVLEGNDADVNNNKLECLTCHVAHGVTQDYWNRTVGVDAGTRVSANYMPLDQLVELSGSSALKRIPNMGTCEACHQKGASNQGYGASVDALAAALAVNTMPNTYAFDVRASEVPAADLGFVGSATCLQGCHKDRAGWSGTTHASSSHTGATGCGRCHNPGNSLMGAVGTFATAGVAGSDAGITCEACHGTGANHVKAPSALNIFNPAKASIERQVIECGKCHDVFANSPAVVDTTLATVSGTTYTGTVSGKIPSKSKLSDLVDLAGWSVAFRAYGQDPAKFADATQLNATSNHYGGAWGFANSKHFIGTGTPENPNGVVSCSTCHDMHNSTHAGLVKFEYTQLCASCHTNAFSLASSVAMPTNNWNRHQIEANDWSHSFTRINTPATIAAVDIENVNLESASSDFTTFAHSVYYSTYAPGNEAKGPEGTGYNQNLWRSSQTGGGGIGKRVKAYSDAGKSTRVYNNYEMTWTLTAKPAGVTEGVDFEIVPEGGAIEFTNPGTGVLADYAKFTGTYTMHYVVNSAPAVNGDISFTIQPNP